jgi:hypothetical protein
MPAKKIYFLNGDKVKKNKIPVNAKHIGDNIYRQINPSNKIATKIVERFYLIKNKSND